MVTILSISGFIFHRDRSSVLSKTFKLCAFSQQFGKVMQWGLSVIIYNRAQMKCAHNTRTISSVSTRLPPTKFFKTFQKSSVPCSVYSNFASSCHVINVLSCDQCLSCDHYMLPYVLWRKENNQNFTAKDWRIYLSYCELNTLFTILSSLFKYFWKLLPVN